MSEAITTSSSDHQQWVQYHPYQYQNFDEVPHGGLISDSISVSSNFSTAPENSCGVGNDLSPKGNLGKAPLRRRSRTSRRAPTTLLNATIKNFRTLVQQYTGCQTGSSSSFKNHKGPINLSFGSSKESSNHDFAATNNFQEQNQHYDQEYVHEMYQGQQGNLLPVDEKNADFSDFSSSGQNLMTVNNFGPCFY